MAALPLVLYAQTGEGRVKAVGNPIYRILGKMPNMNTTAYEFWHMYVVNLMLTPGGYARVMRDRIGTVTALWNIPTANVVSHDTNVSTGERYVDVLLGPDGKKERLREGEYMHTPGFRFVSDVQPENPIFIASEVLGLTMALNGYAKDFFESGSNMGGFVEYPESIGEDAYNKFKESWQATYAGVTNQHRIAFLEDGFKFTQLGKNPNESQALESRKFQVTEICRLMGVPPHKVFDLDRATFSNIEQQNIEYVQESIAPMAVRIEQTIYKDLLLPSERNVYFAKFNLNGLLRGDIASRTTYYNTMRQNGVLNADEIREYEDMNRIPAGEGGDAYLVNGNMISLNTAKNSIPKSQATGKGGTP